jgi:hypothetical protein
VVREWQGKIEIAKLVLRVAGGRGTLKFAHKQEMREGLGTHSEPEFRRAIKEEIHSETARGNSLKTLLWVE